MNLAKVLEQLHEELRNVDLAIASLEQLESARQTSGSARGDIIAGVRAPGAVRRPRRKHRDSQA